MVISDFKKVVAVLTTILFISTSINFNSNLYAQPMVASLPALDINKITVNGSAASLEERFRGTEGPEGRTVIAVQDAHGIFDAQENIRVIIQELQDQYGFELVGLEGGVGKSDHTFLRTFPDKEINAEQARKYMKRAELSGGEAAAILNPKPGIFYGIENSDLYFQNRNSFIKALETKDANLHAINLIEKKLDKARSKIFPEKMIAFHRAAQNFQRGRMSLLDFVTILQSESAAAAIPMNAYPNVLRLFEAIAKARKAGNKESVNKEVQDATSKIEGRVLFEEIEAMTNAINSKLLPSGKPAEELLAQFHELQILRNLVSLQMTRKEYQEFLKTDFSNYKDLQLAPAETFYRDAVKRDQALYDNFIAAMKHEKKDRAIIVTGGFHEEGLRDRLRKENISYVFYMPRIQTITPQDDYYRVMSGKVSYNNKNGRANSIQAILATMGLDPKLEKEFTQTYAVGGLRALAKKVGSTAGLQSYAKIWQDAIIKTIKERGETLRDPSDLIALVKNVVQLATGKVDVGDMLDQLEQSFNETLSGEARDRVNQFIEVLKKNDLNVEKALAVQGHSLGRGDVMLADLEKRFLDKPTMKNREAFATELLRHRGYPGARERLIELLSDVRVTTEPVREEIRRALAALNARESRQYIFRKEITESTLFQGHEGSVNSANFSPDGTKIVSAGESGAVRVWDAKTGSQLAVLRGHKDGVTSANFSADGTKIISASYDGTVRVWDVRTGSQLAILQGHGSPVYFANFSADGTKIVSAGESGAVRVWDAHTGSQLVELQGHGSPVDFANFSPDGTKIVSVGNDGTVRVWDVRTGSQLAMLQGHGSPVNFANFSPDGTKIVSADHDGTVRVWDVRTGSELVYIPGYMDYGVNSVNFSADGTKIVWAEGDGTVRVWDVRTGSELAVLQGHEGEVRTANFSPDGAKIVSAGDDGTIRIWQARHRDEIPVPENAPDFSGMESQISGWMRQSTNATLLAEEAQRNEARTALAREIRQTASGVLPKDQEIPDAQLFDLVFDWADAHNIEPAPVTAASLGARARELKPDETASFYIEELDKIYLGAPVRDPAKEPFNLSFARIPGAKDKIKVTVASGGKKVFEAALKAGKSGTVGRAGALKTDDPNLDEKHFEIGLSESGNRIIIKNFRPRAPTYVVTTDGKEIADLLKFALRADVEKRVLESSYTEKQKRFKVDEKSLTPQKLTAMAELFAGGKEEKKVVFFDYKIKFLPFILEDLQNELNAERQIIEEEDSPDFEKLDDGLSLLLLEKEISGSKYGNPRNVVPDKSTFRVPQNELSKIKMEGPGNTGMKEYRAKVDALRDAMYQKEKSAFDAVQAKKQELKAKESAVKQKYGSTFVVRALALDYTEKDAQKMEKKGYAPANRNTLGADKVAMARFNLNEDIRYKHYQEEKRKTDIGPKIEEARALLGKNNPKEAYRKAAAIEREELEAAGQPAARNYIEIAGKLQPFGFILPHTDFARQMVEGRSLGAIESAEHNKITSVESLPDGKLKEAIQYLKSKGLSDITIFGSTVWKQFVNSALPGDRDPLSEGFIPKAPKGEIDLVLRDKAQLQEFAEKMGFSTFDLLRGDGAIKDGWKFDIIGWREGEGKIRTYLKSDPNLYDLPRFTLNKIGITTEGRWMDPFGGIEDARQGRLKWINPKDRPLPMRDILWFLSFINGTGNFRTLNGLPLTLDQESLAAGKNQIRRAFNREIPKQSLQMKHLLEDLAEIEHIKAMTEEYVSFGNSFSDRIRTFFIRGKILLNIHWTLMRRVLKHLFQNLKDREFKHVYWSVRNLFSLLNPFSGISRRIKKATFPEPYDSKISRTFIFNILFSSPNPTQTEINFADADNYLRTFDSWGLGYFLRNVLLKVPEPRRVFEQIEENGGAWLLQALGLDQEKILKELDQFRHDRKTYDRLMIQNGLVSVKNEEFVQTILYGSPDRKVQLDRFILEYQLLTNSDRTAFDQLFAIAPDKISAEDWLQVIAQFIARKIPREAVKIYQQGLKRGMHIQMVQQMLRKFGVRTVADMTTLLTVPGNKFVLDPKNLTENQSDQALNLLTQILPPAKAASLGASDVELKNAIRDWEMEKDGKQQILRAADAGVRYSQSILGDSLETANIKALLDFRRVLWRLDPHLNDASWVKDEATRNQYLDLAAQINARIQEMYERDIKGQIPPARTFEVGAMVRSAQFSPDGKEVLTGSQDGTARVWNRETGAEIRRFDVGSWVSSTQFSPDGKEVMTGSDDGIARVWNRETGTEIRRFFNVGSTVRSAQFSRDGKEVLTGVEDGTVRVWNRETGAKIRRFNVGSGVRFAQFSPDGKEVLTGVEDGTVRVWNRETGAEIRRFFNVGSQLRSAQFSPDGKEVLTGSYDGTARLWSMETGAEIRRFFNVGSGVWSVQFSRDGKEVLTGSGDGTVRVWNRETGAEIRRFNVGSQVRSIQFSPDGKEVLTGGRDGTARLWNLPLRAEYQYLVPKYPELQLFGQELVTGASLGTGSSVVRKVNQLTGDIINLQRGRPYVPEEYKDLGYVTVIEGAKRAGFIGDVQGNFKEMKEAILKSGFIDDRGNWKAGDAVFAFAGDLVDSGPESAEVLDFIMKLRDQAARAGGRVIAVRGNHDDMMLQALESLKDVPDKSLDYSKIHVAGPLWWPQGGKETAISFLKNAGIRVPEEDKDIFIAFRKYMSSASGKTYLTFIRSLPYAAKINNVLLVHGGPDFDAKNLRELGETPESRKTLSWFRRWEGRAEDIAEFKQNMGVDFIVYGHTQQGERVAGKQFTGITDYENGIFAINVLPRAATGVEALAVLNFDNHGINFIFGKDKIGGQTLHKAVTDVDEMEKDRTRKLTELQESLQDLESLTAGAGEEAEVPTQATFSTSLPEGGLDKLIPPDIPIAEADRLKLVKSLTNEEKGMLNVMARAAAYHYMGEDKASRKFAETFTKFRSSKNGAFTKLHPDNIRWFLNDYGDLTPEQLYSRFTRLMTEGFERPAEDPLVSPSIKFYFPFVLSLSQKIRQFKTLMEKPRKPDSRKYSASQFFRRAGLDEDEKGFLEVLINLNVKPDQLFEYMRMMSITDEFEFLPFGREHDDATAQAIDDISIAAKLNRVDVLDKQFMNRVHQALVNYTTKVRPAPAAPTAPGVQVTEEQLAERIADSRSRAEAEILAKDPILTASGTFGTADPSNPNRVFVPLEIARLSEDPMDPDIPGMTQQSLDSLRSGYAFWENGFTGNGPPMFTSNEMGETMTGGGGTLTPNEAEAVKKYRSVFGIPAVAPNEAQRQFEELKKHLREFGIELRGNFRKHQGGNYLLINRILTLIPPSLKNSPSLRIIDLNGGRVKAARASAYDDETARVVIYPWAMDHNDRRVFTALVIHEIGHSIQGALDPQELEAISQAHAVLGHNKAFIHTEYFLPDRAGYQYSFPEFFAEMNLIYISRGDYLRSIIQSHPNPEVRAAYQKVYDIYRNLHGREYSESRAINQLDERAAVLAGVSVADVRRTKKSPEFPGPVKPVALELAPTPAQGTRFPLKQVETELYEDKYERLMGSKTFDAGQFVSIGFGADPVSGAPHVNVTPDAGNPENLIIRVSFGQGGLEYKLEKGQKKTIGRGNDVDIRMVDPRISRHHAEISLSADGSKVTIKDMGSANGTFIPEGLRNTEKAVPATVPAPAVSPQIPIFVPTKKAQVINVGKMLKEMEKSIRDKKLDRVKEPAPAAKGEVESYLQLLQTYVLSIPRSSEEQALDLELFLTFIADLAWSEKNRSEVNLMRDEVLQTPWVAQWIEGYEKYVRGQVADFFSANQIPPEKLTFNKKTLAVTVNLTGIKISDVSALAKIKNLRTIYLAETNVSDLTPLMANTKLERVYLRGSAVTPEAAEAFRQAHPNPYLRLVTGASLGTTQQPAAEAEYYSDDIDEIKTALEAGDRRFANEKNARLILWKIGLLEKPGPTESALKALQALVKLDSHFATEQALKEVLSALPQPEFRQIAFQVLQIIEKANPQAFTEENLGWLVSLRADEMSAAERVVYLQTLADVTAAFYRMNKEAFSEEILIDLIRKINQADARLILDVYLQLEYGEKNKIHGFHRALLSFSDPELQREAFRLLEEYSVQAKLPVLLGIRKSLLDWDAEELFRDRDWKRKRRALSFMRFYIQGKKSEDREIHENFPFPPPLRGYIVGNPGEQVVHDDLWIKDTWEKFDHPHVRPFIDNRLIIRDEPLVFDQIRNGLYEDQRFFSQNLFWFWFQFQAMKDIEIKKRILDEMAVVALMRIPEEVEKNEMIPERMQVELKTFHSFLERIIAKDKVLRSAAKAHRKELENRFPFLAKGVMGWIRRKFSRGPEKVTIKPAMLGAPATVTSDTTASKMKSVVEELGEIPQEKPGKQIPGKIAEGRSLGAENAIAQLPPDVREALKLDDPAAKNELIRNITGVASIRPALDAYSKKYLKWSVFNREAQREAMEQLIARYVDERYDELVAIYGFSPDRAAFSQLSSVAPDKISAEDWLAILEQLAARKVPREAVRVYHQGLKGLSSIDLTQKMLSFYGVRDMGGMTRLLTTPGNKFVVSTQIMTEEQGYQALDLIAEILPSAKAASLGRGDQGLRRQGRQLALKTAKPHEAAGAQIRVGWMAEAGKIIQEASLHRKRNPSSEERDVVIRYAEWLREDVIKNKNENRLEEVLRYLAGMEAAGAYSDEVQEIRPAILSQDWVQTWINRYAEKLTNTVEFLIVDDDGNPFVAAEIDRNTLGVRLYFALNGPDTLAWLPNYRDELRNLEELDLSESHLGDDNVDVLSYFPNLKKLDLRRRSVTDLSVLSKLKNLEQLDLRDGVLSEQDVFNFLLNPENPKKLRYPHWAHLQIILTDEQILRWEGSPENGEWIGFREQDFAGYPKGFNLLTGEQIDRLKFALREFAQDNGRPDLEAQLLDRIFIHSEDQIELTLGESDRFEALEGISNYKALAGWKELAFLNLAGMNLKDLKFLSDFPDLQGLDISFNPVRDLTPLSHLKVLESLDLEDLPVSDLKPLSGLSKLIFLKLNGTFVKDISALENLKELQGLDLKLTDISEEQVFAFFRDPKNPQKVRHPRWKHLQVKLSDPYRMIEWKGVPENGQPVVVQAASLGETSPEVPAIPTPVQNWFGSVRENWNKFSDWVRAKITRAPPEEIKLTPEEEKIRASANPHYELIGGTPDPDRARSLREFTGLSAIAWDEKNDVYSPISQGISFDFAGAIAAQVKEMSPPRRAGGKAKKLARPLRVLVIGSGTGLDALTAAHQASVNGLAAEITVTDIHAPALANTKFNMETLAGKPVEVHQVGPGRAGVEAFRKEIASKTFDLILFNAPDAKPADSVVRSAFNTQMNENDLREILDASRALLAPDGVFLLRNLRGLKDRGVIPEGYVDNPPLLRINETDHRVFTLTQAPAKAASLGALPWASDLDSQIKNLDLMKMDLSTIRQFSEKFRQEAIQNIEVGETPIGKAVEVWKTLDLAKDKDLERFLIGSSVIQGIDQVSIPLLTAYLHQSPLEVDDRVIASFEALLTSTTKWRGPGSVSIRQVGTSANQGLEELIAEREAEDRLEKSFAGYLSSPIKTSFGFTWIELLSSKKTDKRIQLLRNLLADSQKEKQFREYPTIYWHPILVDAVAEALDRLVPSQTSETLKGIRYYYTFPNYRYDLLTILKQKKLIQSHARFGGVYFETVRKREDAWSSSRLNLKEEVKILKLLGKRMKNGIAPDVSKAEVKYATQFVPIMQDWIKKVGSANPELIKKAREVLLDRFKNIDSLTLMSGGRPVPVLMGFRGDAIDKAGVEKVGDMASRYLKSDEFDFGDELASLEFKTEDDMRIFLATARREKIEIPVSVSFRVGDNWLDSKQVEEIDKNATIVALAKPDLEELRDQVVAQIEKTMGASLGQFQPEEQKIPDKDYDVISGTKDPILAPDGVFLLRNLTGVKDRGVIPEGLVDNPPLLRLDETDHRVFTLTAKAASLGDFSRTKKLFGRDFYLTADRLDDLRDLVKTEAIRNPELGLASEKPTMKSTLKSWMAKVSGIPVTNISGSKILMDQVELWIKWMKNDVTTDSSEKEMRNAVLWDLEDIFLAYKSAEGDLLVEKDARVELIEGLKGKDLNPEKIYDFIHRYVRRVDRNATNFDVRKQIWIVGTAQTIMLGFDHPLIKTIQSAFRIMDAELGKKFTKRQIGAVVQEVGSSFPIRRTIPMMKEFEVIEWAGRPSVAKEWQEFRGESFLVILKNLGAGETVELKIGKTGHMVIRKSDQGFELEAGPQKVNLEEGKVLKIGRESDNDIQITDRQVSSNHLQLEYRNGTLLITDLKSLSGTYARIAPASGASLGQFQPEELQFLASQPKLGFAVFNGDPAKVIASLQAKIKTDNDVEALGEALLKYIYPEIAKLFKNKEAAIRLIVQAKQRLNEADARQVADKLLNQPAFENLTGKPEIKSKLVKAFTAIVQSAAAEIVEAGVKAGESQRAAAVDNFSRNFPSESARKSIELIALQKLAENQKQILRFAQDDKAPSDKFQLVTDIGSLSSVKQGLELFVGNAFAAVPERSSLNFDVLYTKNNTERVNAMRAYIEDVRAKLPEFAAKIRMKASDKKDLIRTLQGYQKRLARTKNQYLIFIVPDVQMVTDLREAPVIVMSDEDIPEELSFVKGFVSQAAVGLAKALKLPESDARRQKYLAYLRDAGITYTKDPQTDKILFSINLQTFVQHLVDLQRAQAAVLKAA